MKPLIRKFVKLASEHLPMPAPVYEFGSYQLPGQEKLADLRPFFPGKKFIGTDIRKGPGVDRVCDIHRTGLPGSSAGTILCLDTLEHVTDPVRAVQELLRVLKPGGCLIVSSTMHFPIHDHPWDFWRFTPQAMETLLKQFGSFKVWWSGDMSFPHAVVGIAFKSKKSPSALNSFSKLMNKRNPLRGGLMEAALMALPPFIAGPIYRMFSALRSRMRKDS